MATPLHILFIDVAQAGVDTLLAELRRGDYAPQAVVVGQSSLADMLTDAFQLVIAGALNQEQGLVCQISQSLQDRHLDIPLLVYSSAGSHDHIVELMHAGAQDFISVNNPARILTAVQRELANARQRAGLREQIVTDYLLREIDGMILKSWDVVPLVTQVCQRVLELFDLTLVWIGSKQPDGSVKVLAGAGEVEYLKCIEVRWDDTPQGHGAAGLSIRQGQPVVMMVDSAEFAPWSERAQRYGMQSVLSLPMTAHSDVTGALLCYSTKREVFDEAAVQRFSAFANRVAVALLVTQEQQQLRLLSSAMNSAINAMFITKRDGTIIWFNDALMTFSGYSSEQIMNSTPHLFSSGEHDATYWLGMWSALQQGKAWRGDVVNRRRDGSLYSVVQNVTPLFDNQGVLTHFLAVQQDVSEKKELEREIEYLAYHDVLTGLPNRVLFQDRMQQAITQAKRDKTHFALLFVDLDGFKNVNDTLGHAGGDQLLKIIADRLRASVRDGDTVARLSGDEFTVLLRDASDVMGLKRVASDIIQRISQPCAVFESYASVTASVGISLYPEHAQGVEKLMIYADEAMYRAKESGKNTYQFYQPKIV